MQNLMLVLIAIFFSTTINSQVLQCLPRDGEGLKNKSNKAVFWINPIGLQPSIFFNKEGIDTHRNRKWWRNSTVSPTSVLLGKEQMGYHTFAPKVNRSPIDFQKCSINSSPVLKKFGSTIPKVVPLWENTQMVK